MTIEIKPISTYEEYKAAEQMQAEVLGFGSLDVVPYQILQSFAQSGGAVIGAFDHDKLIGVVMGYTGLLQEGTPYHRSQRMAVLASYRGQGVGAALKHAQADVARSHGLRLMCWTFDPLRALNAHLNLHKLGAKSSRYIENAYYASSSPRDAGAPIDRLWVEWDIALREPHERPIYTLPPSPIKAITLLDGRPSAPDLGADAPIVIIQIPHNIDDVRTQGAQGADRLLEWRMATRAAFGYYLAVGYVTIDYVRELGYILVKA